MDTWLVVIKPQELGRTANPLGGEPSQFLDAYPAVHAEYPLPVVQEFVDYLPGQKHQCVYLFDRDGRLRSWSR